MNSEPTEAMKGLGAHHANRNRKGLRIQANSTLSWIRDSLEKGPIYVSPTRMTDVEERVLESNWSRSTTARNLYQYQRPGQVQRAKTGLLMATRNDTYTQYPETIAHRRSNPFPATINSGVDGMFSHYESLLERLLEEGEQLDIVNTTDKVVVKPSSKVEQNFRKENSRAQIQRLKLCGSSTFLPLSPAPRGSISRTVKGASSFDLTRHLGASDALAAVRHTLNFMSMKNAGCGMTALDLIRSVGDIRVSQSNNKILLRSRIVDYGNELFSGERYGVLL